MTSIRKSQVFFISGAALICTAITSDVLKQREEKKQEIEND